MSVSFTVEMLKANYLQKLVSVTDYDVVLASIIADIVAQAIDYLDDDDVTTAATLPSILDRPLIKQSAYEFSRRQDLGLISNTAPDGSISKMEVGQWLDDVEAILDRHKYYTL